MEENTLPKLLVSKKEAEKKIQEQIDKGQQLHNQQIDSKEKLDKAKADFNNWSNYNETLLSKLFSNSSIALRYSFYIYGGSTNSSLNYDIERHQKDISEMVSRLQGICGQLELYDERLETSSRIFGNDVFIVHGHDEAAKHKIARFIDDLDLTATILDEQPSRGQTIIDKFEEHADKAGFAIVLLTSDDLGAPKDNKNELKPRARQNVILELGYFLCSLGRERVRVLHEEGVELPSDIYGLSYVQMAKGGGWKLELAQEMASVGISVDLNKLVQKK